MMKKIGLFLFLLLFFLVGCQAKPTSFQVTFETDEGTIIPTQTIEQGKTILIPNDPLKEGYTFDWWYLDEEFTTELELDYVVNEDITIYAKWIGDEYTIGFNSNGGSPTAQQLVKRDEKVLEPTDPTRVHYTFVGWFLEDQLYDFDLPVTQGFVLEARWTEAILDPIDLDEYDAYYIVTSPGEDASTSMLVNYHTKNTDTSLEYTLASDPSFLEATILTGSIRGFESTVDMEKPFEIRNVVRVSLTDLDPATKYIYRINKGNDTYSETYAFETAGPTNPTSFLFITDVHYYDGFDGAEIVETLVSSAKEIQPGLDFIFSTGDLVDTGGNADDWDRFFSHGQSLKCLPFTNSPGNHEHYIIGNMRNKIYSSYFHFPQNGNEEYRGVSHYFAHNDTLFIQIDTDSPYNQGEQLGWLDDVLANNTASFIVVGTHAPMNVVDNVDYNRAFLALMEKYAVDLVLAGHYHSHNIQTLYLDQAPTNNQIGVTYLRGAGSGIKAIGSQTPEEFAKGYIVDILESSIQIRYINARGDLLQTWTIENHKLDPREVISNEDLFASIRGEYLESTQEIEFSWSNKAYKNVKSIVIEELYREKRMIELLVPTPGYIRYPFGEITKDLDYHFKVSVLFLDDSIQEKTFMVNLKEGFNLTVDDITTSSAVLHFDGASEEYRSIIKEYEIYHGERLLATFLAKDSLTFEQITSYILRGLISNTDYELVVKAIGRNGFMYQDQVSFKTN